MTQHKESSPTMGARYERAQKMMQGIWSKELALNTTVFPIWIDNSDCFWYERTIQTSEEGTHQVSKEYRLVDASKATNSLAFDHSVLAASLAEAATQQVSANNLPISKVEMAFSSQNSSDTTIDTVSFTAFKQRWIFVLKTGICSETVFPQGNGEVTSPDGKSLIFVRAFNLWLRDIESGDERALTRDGEADYRYGAAGTAWSFQSDDSLQVSWSADSKQIFTVQHDTRQVKTFPVIQHVPTDGSLRPTVDYHKAAYPGDDHIETFRLLAIDIAAGRIQSANYRQIPEIRNSHGLFTAKLAWWARDNRHTYFIDMDRGYQAVRLVEFDSHTGATRILFEETSDTHISLMLNDDEKPTIVPLPESNELLWFSERSGWAHLYLYDLQTGQLKHAVTQGEWLVRDIAHVDIERREIVVHTAGRVKERDPYYCDLARVNIDTGEITTLISSDHEYFTVIPSDLGVVQATLAGFDISKANGLSPSGNFAVTTRSRADELPVSLLIDRDGKEIMLVETADISPLMAVTQNRWQWPEPVKLLAADGKTDIYGLVFRPSDFSPDHSYPVVSHVFSTPEIPWVSKGSFTNGTTNGFSYLDAAAVAELGFIVVQIDGRGTSCRNKSFLDESYGWAESASNLDDHVVGIQQLAVRYSYMDLDRVGITSHPSGAPGGVQGLLQHPDFYGVGVASLLHDSRFCGATMWGDKYEGLAGPAVEPNAAKNSNYQYPEDMVENLKGKLLLAGGMRSYVGGSISATFRVIDALQKANKDFDLLLLPDAPSSYLTRRAWDYLVIHLQNVEPPKEFKLTSIFGV